jgi:hypothetical protein
VAPSDFNVNPEYSLNDSTKDPELEQRHRPAMAESTEAQGVLYRRITRVLFAASLLLLFFFVPMYGHTVGFNLLGISNPLHGIVPGFVFVLLYGLCILGGILLSKKARRHAAPRFVNLESPPGVLFLRPFTEDTDVRAQASWGRDSSSMSFSQRLKVLKLQLSMQREVISQSGSVPELGEILARLTQSFGNMAAIGEPGSPPILGADNVYVSDENWQEQVLEMAQGAKLVILTIGTTPGVIWEIENMLRIVPPSQLLLNIPGMTSARRRKNYKVFRNKLEHLFPQGLPEELRRRALAFSDDWTPLKDTKTEPDSGTSSHVAWWMSRVLR